MQLFSSQWRHVLPSKVKLLRMKRGICVVRRRCAGDGPLTFGKLYSEYNRKIAQLILHRDHVHYLTRRITPSQVPFAHNPGCKAEHIVPVQN